MKLNIPEYVKKVVDTLEQKGYEAYVVGGAVRDAMLGKIPEDWDVATNALAKQTGECFERHFDTGIKHGTVTVLMDHKPVEVTTYRVDGEYKDNRRPESVKFTENIEDDLKRRDFTINAMAYSEERGLLDLYGGSKDLEEKIIRCVGDADTRFNEDALRIMRAIRFSVKLGFEIDDETMTAIKKNCKLLENISGERIQAELVKTLEADRDITILFKSGVAEVIMPEVDFEKISLNVRGDVEIKLSAMLYYCENPRGFFNRLKFDNRTKNNVLKIMECARYDVEESLYGVKKILNRYGETLFEKALCIMECYGKNTDVLREFENVAKQQPYLIKHLCISGNDITGLGITGQSVGRVMNTLMDDVMKNPQHNTREYLTTMAMKIK